MPPLRGKLVGIRKIVEHKTLPHRKAMVGERVRGCDAPLTGSRSLPPGSAVTDIKRRRRGQMPPASGAYWGPLQVRGLWKARGC